VWKDPARHRHGKNNDYTIKWVKTNTITLTIKRKKITMCTLTIKKASNGFIVTVNKPYSGVTASYAVCSSSVYGAVAADQQYVFADTKTMTTWMNEFYKEAE
jgi:predicted methyltransferase MtxX (methanogen marker protein 4)